VTSSAYVLALTLLARRELSEAQVRQRLQRRGHPHSDIEHAIERLKQERAIDDARVAGAMARAQASVKRRGKLRVRRYLEAAGIDRNTARRAVDEAFEDVDETTLIEMTMTRRLRGRTIATDTERRRLYRYLISQGFEADQVLKALDAPSRRRPH
jgi:regulatory protein